MHSIETRERFIELRASGWSFAKIAEELAEARKLRRDCLRERLGLTEEKRLERLVSILERLEKRLGDETFESLPPEKALRMYFDVSSKVEAAFGENKCEPLSPMERLTAENF